MYFYRARYYDSYVGRFVTKDPISFAGGDVNLYAYVDSVGQAFNIETNLYAYTGNSPVNLIDTLGLYWQYSQSTGQLSYVNNQTGETMFVGNGYSGIGEGLNNSNMQNVPYIGPIPQGTYDIGQAYWHRTLGPVTMNLNPRTETNTFGRDLFRIHGDNACRCQNASEGCVVLPRNIRERINNNIDRELRVVQ